MAKAFKLRVGYLLAEFLTHADVLLGFGQTAGTIALLAAKTLANLLGNRLIGVEINLHFATSFLYYFTIFSA